MATALDILGIFLQIPTPQWMEAVEKATQRQTL